MGQEAETSGWTELKAWSDEHSGIIALAAFSLPILFGILKFLYAPKRWERLEAYFDDPASYPMLLARYRGNSADAYFTAIRRVLFFANRVYGRKLVSWRAFGMCLNIAYLYPIIAMFLAWVLVNQWNPGGLEIFGNVNSGFERLWRVGLIAIGLSIAFGLFAIADLIASFTKTKIVASSNNENSRIRLPVRVISGLLEFSVFALIGGLSGLVVVVFAVLGTMSFVIAIAFSVAIAYAISVGFAGTSATIGAFGFILFFAFLRATELSTIIFLLFLVFPVLNAAADLVSLAVTRRFLRGVSRNRAPVWRILAGFGFDLFAASLCLLVLLGMIVSVLDIWSAISPPTMPLDWRAYWADVKADPAKGIALYLIVATTLIPTFVHFAVGLGGILTHKGRLLRRVQTALESRIAAGGSLSAIERDQMVANVKHAVFWGYGVAIFATGLVTYVLAAVMVWVLF